MKSSNVALIHRGYVNKEILDRYANKSFDELQALLYSSIAVDRTAAVLLLRKQTIEDDPHFLRRLISLLENETALYTKIEICTAIADGGLTALEMIYPLLGMIGTNQHTHLPETVSLKKSYPMPRDIVARTICQMDAEVIPKLIMLSEVLYPQQLVELIDALGYLFFYNKEYATDAYLKRILSIYEHNKKSEVIVWKFSTLLSAFTTPLSHKTLHQIAKETTSKLIQDEISRSFSFSSNETASS